MDSTKRNRLEMIVAICAVLTSVIALFVAWDQGRVMRAQQHGAVYPVLQVDGFVSTTSSDRELGIAFSNSGVGPALIETVDVYHAGKKIEGLKGHFSRMPANHELSWSSMVGRAVAPGEKIRALVLSWPLDGLTHQDLVTASQEWSHVELNVCYCSVFGRCWVTSGLANSETQKVKKCVRSDIDIFEDFSTAEPVPEQEATEVE